MTQFHIGRDGTQFGPYDEAHANSLFAQGTITATDLVWREGMSDWRIAAEVFGVAATITTPAISPKGKAEVGAAQMGYCPSCTKAVHLDSEDCKHCSATFGSSSSWQVSTTPIATNVDSYRNLIPYAFCSMLILLAGVAVSPYIMLWFLKSDLRSGNGSAVAEAIDFTALRSSLKASIFQVAANDLEQSGSEGGLAGAGRAIGAGLGAGLAGAMVDAMVTPEGVASLISKNGADAAKRSQDPGTTDEGIRTGKTNYRSWGQFEVELGRGDEMRATLIVTRRNIFGWKITGLRIWPKNLGR